MATYEVVGSEVTLHRKVGELRDPVSGQVTGIIQGQGRTYTHGQTVDERDISPIILEALNDKDHPSHEHVSRLLKKSDGKSDPKAAAPFAGYDDLDEDEVLSAIRNLPSEAIQRVKDYEAENQGRERIVDYMVGFGESVPHDRVEGHVGSPHQDEDEDKAVRKLKTREVHDDGVELGEGYTGTGTPDIPYGAHEEEENESSSGSRTAKRRGRRPRAKQNKSEE